MLKFKLKKDEASRLISEFEAHVCELLNKGRPDVNALVESAGGTEYLWPYIAAGEAHTFFSGSWKILLNKRVFFVIGYDDDVGQECLTLKRGRKGFTAWYSGDAGKLARVMEYVGVGLRESPAKKVVHPPRPKK